ncbi:hypothetical protein, partial [Thalassospira xiamenensis]|uniref:hypothetical protein n=1 Tax=Thalassospira xiamenensis TaxID=220697 RepID=UPI001C68E8FF
WGRNGSSGGSSSNGLWPVGGGQVGGSTPEDRLSVKMAALYLTKLTRFQRYKIRQNMSNPWCVVPKYSDRKITQDSNNDKKNTHW